MNSAIFKKEDGERIELHKKDIQSYAGTDYPTDNGTVITFKDGWSIRVQEDFSVVDAVFDL